MTVNGGGAMSEWDGTVTGVGYDFDCCGFVLSHVSSRFQFWAN